MVRINQVINAAKSYESLLNVVGGSTVGLSSFGSRTISTPRYKGTISLDKVAKKWVELDKIAFHSDQESKAALSIKRKLQYHYIVSDKMIKKSNNVFVVFSRFIKSCLSAILKSLGIPAKPKSHARKIVELAGEKIHMHHDGKEIRASVGKPFSIGLWHSASTGHKPWKISQMPSFIKSVDQYINFIDHPPGTCGGGDDYVFVFEPKEPGRGDIVMQLPDSPSGTVEKTFTIIAG